MLRRPALLLACWMLSAVKVTPSLAAAWCTANFPNAIFCDDFDGYPDGSSLLEEWVPTGDGAGFCSSFLVPDSDFCASPPHCGKMNTQEHGDLGYSVNAIPDAIRAVFGPTHSTVMGTDEDPLVLELVLNGQTGKGPFNSSFLTLSTGFAYAPTDWAYTPFCSCLSPTKRFPVICQQESPIASCPPIAAAPDVQAIAVGFLAYLDSDPCHCGGSGSHSPSNGHLAFFDGHKWYRLRQGLFPGSGDFLVRSNENRIKVTIKTTSLKVELTCPGTGEYSWCQIPGGYRGPFSSLATGFHKACWLEPDQWDCRADPTCSVTEGVAGGGVPRYDNIVLHGGTCYEPPGACCKPDTSCTEVLGSCECESQGGQFAGSGTTCADTACCPPLPADKDMDGDVDMADFGWFQKCLSGADILPATVPCRCADFDHDDDVDSADFGKLLGCLRGTDIPATPNCLD